MKNAIIYILVIVCGSLALYSQRPVALAKSVTKVEVQKEIMSIRELQQALNDKGHSRYKCKVDGKWGSETAQALENYICDREYKESLR